eukprot:CAMPEP_0204542366 /NCGR_PEP_ID=MMETSP0661-20131031/18916_1 /ASSEMBLY_ACC=CAM_ASM_000606 /TAXON_ID=109239 /ORGANISM="Alexandrium margalefi, Strain AMGDE01CS-322" /LENGTH=34 /DNA_ID= /DNA_START= /DNA_END= /DNA_ORIENTATION=
MTPPPLTSNVVAASVATPSHKPILNSQARPVLFR